MLFKAKNQKQEEFVKLFEENNFSGLLYAATRVGKSKVVIDVTKRLVDLKDIQSILWVVPKVKLRDVTMPSEVLKWADQDLLDKIKFVCYRSLHKEQGQSYDLVVFDEIHHFTEASYESYRRITSTYDIGITATKPENEDRRKLIESILKVVADYSVEQAVEDKVISPYEIYVVNLKMNYVDKDIEFQWRDKETKERKTGKTSEGANYKFLQARYEKALKDREIASYRHQNLISKIQSLKNQTFDEAELVRIDQQYEGIIEKSKKTLSQKNFLYQRAMSLRAGAVYNMRSKVQYAKKLLSEIPDDLRTLILTQRIAVANELCQNRYHSEDIEGYDKFISGEVSRLSACTALDEGVELPNLDVVFIHQAFSIKRQFVQRAGRALGLREGHKGKIIVLRVEGTQDEKWVDNAVSEFKNVKYLSFQEMLNELQLWKTG